MCWDFAASTAAAATAAEDRAPCFFSQAWILASPARRIPSGVRCLVSSRQGCFGSAVVEGPFQRGEVFEQLGLQAVDRPDPVRGLVGTPGGEEPQPGADLIPCTQRLQVSSHPGLVRDDGGVFGVCFAFAAVNLGGVVHGPARNVEDVLAVADEQGDQQRRSAMVQVRRPDHLVPVCELEHVGEELEQCWFVVGDSLGEQPVSVGVDHNAVMMGFAGVDAGP